MLESSNTKLTEIVVSYIALPDRIRDLEHQNNELRAKLPQNQADSCRTTVQMRSQTQTDPQPDNSELERKTLVFFQQDGFNKGAPGHRPQAVSM